MRRNLVTAEPLRQRAGGALRRAAGVDKDQGRAVRLDQFGNAVIDLLPDLSRHNRFERRGWQFESEIARPDMASIDNRAVRLRPALGTDADQKAGDQLDRLL